MYTPGQPCRSARPASVFISHATADDAAVGAIVSRLEAMGVSCWADHTNVEPSALWLADITRALREECDWFMLVLSPSALASRWVRMEALYALASDRFDGRVVPVLLEDCEPGELAFTLEVIQSVDFRHDFEAGFARLKRLWQLAA